LVSLSASQSVSVSVGQSVSRSASQSISNQESNGLSRLAMAKAIALLLIADTLTADC